MSSAWMRITDLADKAREAGRLELASGYEHAAKIVEEVGIASGSQDLKAGDPVREFCKSLCYFGQKYGSGEASECGICQLAPMTLTGIGDGEDDSQEIEKQRAMRSNSEAREAVLRMKARGLNTLAGESKTAPKERCLTPETDDG